MKYYLVGRSHWVFVLLKRCSELKCIVPHGKALSRQALKFEEFTVDDSRRINTLHSLHVS